MLVVIITMGVIFIAIGALVRLNRSDSFLIHYAGLDRDHSDVVNHQAWARRFRNTHFFLGLSTILIGVALYLRFGDSASLLFIILYPMAMYLVLFSRQMFASRTRPSRMGIFAIGIIVATAVFVLLLFRAGHADNEMRFETDQWEIRGIYGEKIRPGDVAYIQLAEQLPEFRLKLNGFATGRIRKGFFQTQDRQRVKLLIDVTDGPYLRVHRTSGDDLYIALQSRPPALLLEEIRKNYPGITIR